jgi:hypothetical protein
MSDRLTTNSLTLILKKNQRNFEVNISVTGVIRGSTQNETEELETLSADSYMNTQYLKLYTLKVFFKLFVA